MKQRMLSTLIAITAVVLMLPSTVLAAKPADFDAAGIITNIDMDDVEPAGESGRWVIVERQITGQVTGDISGAFTLDYGGNVDADQAGNIHGRITAGNYALNINGKSEPIEYVKYPGYGHLPKLAVKGHWTFIKGAEVRAISLPGLYLYLLVRI